MILHTTEVMPLANYHLFLRFNSGLSGEVNLADELDGDLFDALRAPALFATVCQHPVMRTVVWANGADLAPEFLLNLLQAQRQQSAA